MYREGDWMIVYPALTFPSSSCPTLGWPNSKVLFFPLSIPMPAPTYTAKTPPMSALSIHELQQNCFLLFFFFLVFLLFFLNLKTASSFSSWAGASVGRGNFELPPSNSFPPSWLLFCIFLLTSVISLISLHRLYYSYLQLSSKSSVLAQYEK